MNQRPFVWIRIGVAVATTTMVAGCGTRDRRARGEELLKQTSTAIANARGFRGEEPVDGTHCARLEWRHPNVDWTIWIPASGQPLPKKLWVNYKARNRTTVAVIQRASAVLPNLNGQATPANDAPATK